MYGDEDYDGEPVSQTSHMIQCAMKAIAKDEGTELILGAFLHDIGHLLKHTSPAEAMGTFGVVNHEGMGAGFLRSRHFRDRICSVVEMHVQAKRYLVATQETYMAKLSAASLETLKWQGGPMSMEEASEFKHHRYFDDIIKVRLWDEAAKEPDAKIPPLDYFRNLLFEYQLHKI